MRSLPVPALAGLALFALVLGIAGCSEGPANTAPQAVPVDVARPISREVTNYEYYTGRTEAETSINVQARVTGYLVAIDYVNGTEIKAQVKKGQRLFKIDPRPYQAAYDEAMGQVNLAKARLTLAIADYKRAKEVSKTPGAISQQDVDKYAAAEEEARAEVAATEANSESARLNLSFTDITSPIDGQVSRNLIDLKNIVKQDTTLLATIVSEDPIYVYFDVDDHTMRYIQNLIKDGLLKSYSQGGTFPIDIGLTDQGNDFPYHGTLDYVANQLDPTTGTLQLRGKFSNPELRPGAPRLLKPGEFVRVRLPIGPPQPALLVRQAALGTDQGRKYLFVLSNVKEGKGTVEYRPVEVGPQQAGGLQVVKPMKMIRTTEGKLLPATMAELNEGPTEPSITKDDLVIINGLQSVQPDLVVHYSETAMPLPASDFGPPQKQAQPKQATDDGKQDDGMKAADTKQATDTKSDEKKADDKKSDHPAQTPPAPADDKSPPAKPAPVESNPDKSAPR
ncbi:MAG: efflux RND transporter periplasmic adaptor subunit [Planctomycetia bacterium]|nr:efflux RND transporter periplasmic adaptor subunit [Planctomycetia bacterium]